ncbi:unnamed protein product [Brugia timori]|uniref:Uncharacterized protein n=1 Tax=Brugia timori TaxID=42155 RepID=A0A0R3QPU9_9BILA|nr:unnamed protein product [Brugia timori]
MLQNKNPKVKRSHCARRKQKEIYTNKSFELKINNCIRKIV